MPGLARTELFGTLNQITEPFATTIDVLDVWSRSLMGWIEFESLWFFCPGFADELVGREAL